MKKFLIYCLCLLLILFATFTLKQFKNNNTNQDREVVDKKEEDINNEEEDKVQDDNPIILGLYKNYKDNRGRLLIKEYTSVFKYHQDISSFEVYYTNKESIGSDKQIPLFKSYLEQYENIDNYRIGYIINFKTDEKEINKTILKPQDTEEFFEYLEIYLYDDYHQSGGWYSHITNSEFNNESLLTSIKLTAGVNVNKIVSDITLTVFTYDINDNNDFDQNNNYIGNSKYTIKVMKSN